MLNTYLSLLPIYLPYIARIQNLFLESLVGSATAFIKKLRTKRKLSFSWLKPLLLSKQLQPSFILTKILRVPTIVFVLVIFLFIGPHTSVLANWNEKVIPDNRLVQLQKLEEQITSLEIPKFQKPVEITYISTFFSRFHKGVDLPNSAGNPVHPVAKGKVVFAGWSSLGYGNLVIVRHELGFESLYAHLSTVNVSEGDIVDYETVLGKVGSTGFSSGNHLHLEIHQKGEALNPLSLFK